MRALDEPRGQDDVGPRFPARMHSCHLLWHILRLRRKPVAAGARGQRQRGHKAGMRIAEAKLAAMQGRDRAGKAEAEAGAGLRAAGLQPHEAFDGVLAVGSRECPGRGR